MSNSGTHFLVRLNSGNLEYLARTGDIVEWRRINPDDAQLFDYADGASKAAHEGGYIVCGTVQESKAAKKTISAKKRANDSRGGRPK